MDEQDEYKALMEERLAALPKVVQDAIKSADISKRLRELASTHQLHVDQWEVLENEVQLALLGVQPLESLAENLAQEMKMPLEETIPLAADITRIVFEPVREELERELDHPDAQEAVVSAVETARAQVLADNQEPATAVTAAVAPTPIAVAPTPTAPAATVQPKPIAPITTTPPPPVTRAPAAPAYEQGTASHERKVVSGDPYREQV